MGANNSTCLPCKAAAHSGARRGRSGGLSERFSSLIPLKKISTAAEHERRVPSEQDSPVGGQLIAPIEEHSPRTGNPDQPSVNVLRGASKAVSLPAEGDEVKREDISANINEGESCVSPSRRVLPCGQTHLHDETVRTSDVHNAEENEVGRQGSSVFNLRDRSESAPRLENESQASPDPPAQLPSSVDPAGHQHVPTHLLMENDHFSCNDLKRQQSNLQDILSPHSRAVAHRVAAALRAAAGERAAAAATVAAAAAAVTRGESRRSHLPEEDEPLACDSAATATSTQEGEEVCENAGNAGNACSGIGFLTWASSTSIAPLSCFKMKGAEMDESFINHENPLHPEQAHLTRDTDTGSRSSEEIVLEAVRRLNAIFTEAAAAASAAAATGSTAAKERLERHLAIFLRRHDALQRSSNSVEPAVDAEIFRQGVDALVRSLESTLSGSDLKQQVMLEKRSIKLTLTF